MNDQLKSILEQQLRDVHTPDAVSWWPLSIGWWVVIVLVISTLVFSVVKLIKHRKHNAYRKLAVTELNQHFKHWQQHQQNSDYLQAANAVVKRACSHVNNEGLGLSGKLWIAHLNSYCKTDFSNDTEIALTQQLYQEQPNSNINKVHQEINAWLVKHNAKLVDQTSVLNNA